MYTAVGLTERKKRNTLVPLKHRMKKSLLPRWVANRWLREYEWQFSPRYWRLRSVWRNLLRALTIRRYSIGRWQTEQTASVSVLRTMAVLVIGQVALAIAAILLLETLDRWLLPWIGLPQLVESLLSRIGLTPQLNPSIFSSYLGVILQVAAVLLGLYFAAISAVAAAIYSRTPGDVRSLLVAERIGNFYTRLVAFTGAIASILLLLLSFGVTPGILSVAVITVLIVVTLLAFVDLGRNTFNFFDPTELGKNLFRELSLWIESATNRGFAWQNRDFQSFYQQRAEAILETLCQIVNLANRPEYQHLQGKSLTGLLLLLLRMMQIYAREKPHIPSTASGSSAPTGTVAGCLPTPPRHRWPSRPLPHCYQTWSLIAIGSSNRLKAHS